MKTEAIRQAAERLRAQGHFGLASQVEAELTALEESHAEMVKALLEVVNCNAVFTPCRDCAESARAALRKAGAL